MNYTQYLIYHFRVSVELLKLNSRVSIDALKIVRVSTDA